MALRRVLSSTRRLPLSSWHRCTTTEVPPEVEVKQEDNAEEKAEDAEQTEKKFSESYRRNPLLPNCAFLFPGRSKPDQKRLYLRSLRRARFFSSLSIPEEENNEERRSCLWCDREAQIGDKFFCPNCHRVLPTDDNLDFFAMFDLEVNFDVNIPALEETYRKQQMLLHPDKFAAKDTEEQDLASMHAAKINHGYKKLKDSLERAKYLLKVRGFGFSPNQTISDLEFLTEVMSLQEAVAEMTEKKELENFRRQVDERREGLVKSLSARFAMNDLDGASELVTELSYLERVREQIIDRL